MAVAKHSRRLTGKMKRIKKVAIFSLAKFQMVLFGLIGLLFGIFYSFGGLLIDILVSLEVLSAVKMETPGLSYGTFLAFGALIGMPLIGMLFGFFSGILAAILYNLYGKRFGGLKVNFFDSE